MTLPKCGLILCAGLGTRLSPLTDVCPKPLLRFLDEPIASYAVTALHRLGISRVGLNSHQHADQFAAFTEEMKKRQEAGGALPLRFAIAREDTLLGTGGGARGIWEELGSPSGPVIIMNGDVVADYPLDRMIKAHRRTGAVATLLTLPVVAGESNVQTDRLGHFITLLPGSDDSLTSPHHESARPVTYGGVAIVESELFKRLPDGASCIIRRGIAPAMADGEIVAAVHHDGFWADLGTPRRFMQATRLLLDDPKLFGDLWPIEGVAVDGCWVGDRRAVHSSSVLEGPCIVSKGAIVEEDCFIGAGSVIGKGCAVISGSRVSESVLSYGAVADGVVMQRFMVADRGTRWG